MDVFIDHITKNPLYCSLVKRDSLRGGNEVGALAARFRSGVAAAAAERDSEAATSSTPPQQLSTHAALHPGVMAAQQQHPAAGDAMARPSPVKFTVKPQVSSIKPQPERPAVAAGKLSMDRSTMLLQEDLVEFNKEDSEVRQQLVKTSVGDPNTLNLDPDPDFWSNLDPDLQRS